MDYRSHLPLALILLLTLWAYRGLWSAGFVYEDHNDRDALSAPWRGIATEFELLRGRPVFGLPGARFLSRVTFRMQAFWSTSPRGYHAVNLAVHLVNGVLLMLAARPLIGALAPLAAGLFLVHPIQVEAVAAVVNRSELLAAFWVLLSIVLALRLPASGRSSAAVFLCGLCAFWSKETTAVALIFGLGTWFRMSSQRDGWYRWMLPVLLWLPVLAVAYAALVSSRELHVFDRAGYGAFVGQQLCAVGVLWVRSLVPMTQTVDLDVSHLSASVAWGRVVAVVVGAALVAWCARRSHAVAWGRWALSWTAACVWLRVIAPQPEHLHEHGWYLPLAAIAVAVVAISVGVVPSLAWMSSARPLEDHFNGAAGVTNYGPA